MASDFFEEIGFKCPDVCQPLPSVLQAEIEAVGDPEVISRMCKTYLACAEDKEVYFELWVYLHKTFP